jgi:hypothetical protein
MREYKRGVRIYKYKDYEIEAYNKDDAVRILNKKYGFKLKPLLSYHYKDLQLIFCENWKNWKRRRM